MIHRFGTRHTLIFAVCLSGGSFGCGRKVPSHVAPVLESHRATIEKVANDAALLCPGTIRSAPFQKNPMDAPPPPPNPAIGTSLESDARVLDVFILCSWPDPRDPSGATWGGGGIPSMRRRSQVPTKAVTMPEDFAENTCRKTPHNCTQVVVPSRYSTVTQSADIRVKRPTSDGGEVEVVVLFEVP